MFNEVFVQRLTIGTTFKLVAIGMLVTFIPFGLLTGFLAPFGANTLAWKNKRHNDASRAMPYEETSTRLRPLFLAL